METTERHQQHGHKVAPNYQRIGGDPAGKQDLWIDCSWDGDAAICTWQPQPHHAMGAAQVLKDGIIAKLIDRHCACAAGAAGNQPGQRGVTTSLWVTYLRPIPFADPVVLRARVADRAGRKVVVACTVASGGREYARGKLVIQAPDDQACPI